MSITSMVAPRRFTEEVVTRQDKRLIELATLAKRVRRIVDECELREELHKVTLDTGHELGGFAEYYLILLLGAIGMYRLDYHPLHRLKAQSLLQLANEAVARRPPSDLYFSLLRECSDKARIPGLDLVPFTT